MVERSEELIQGYLSGMLVAEEVAELESWLVASPSHRLQYAQAIRFHARVRQLASDRVASVGMDSGSTRMTTERSGRWRSRRRALPLLRWQGWAAVAALVLLVIAGWRICEPTVSVHGVVRLVGGDLTTSTGAPIIAGAWFSPETQLISASVATLEWQDGSRIAVSSTSRFHVAADSVVLDGGRLDAEIASHAPTRPFTIATLHATVIVIGTHFSVAADDQHTAVAVTHGRVRVRAQHGDERLLAGGESAVARAAGFDGRTLLVAAMGTVIPGTYASIQAAIAAARPGDTVELLPGHHGSGNAVQQVLINGGGRAGAPLIVRAQPGAEILSTSSNAVRLIDAAWVRLEGLHLRQADVSRAGNGIHLERCQHITVTGCTVIGFAGDGITCANSGHVELQGNHLADCGGDASWANGGIVVVQPTRFDASPGPLVSIIGNHIQHSRMRHPNDQGDWTGGNGISFFADPSSPLTERCRIAGNCINGNDGSAILSFHLGALDIEDNTCHANGRHPRHAGAELAVTTADCVFLRNLLIPSPGRRAWALGRAVPRQRSGNRVVGITAVPTERLLTNPYLIHLRDESVRDDFQLVPGLNAGANL